MNESKARVRRYLDEHKPPFLALYDDRGVSVRAYDVPATSFIVVVDRTGKVSYTGSGDRQDLAGGGPARDPLGAARHDQPCLGHLPGRGEDADLR